MNEEIFKIIEPRLKNLPEDIKSAILKEDIGGRLAEISKKHSLHIDQSAILENETLMILVGLESSEEYLSNLMKGLRLSHEKAAEIVADVNKTIFADIRSSLQKMAEDIKKEDNDESLHVDHSHLIKKDVLKEIEEPVHVVEHSRQTTVPDHQFTMPRRVSSGLSGLGNKLRDREFTVVTDAKRMEDAGREQIPERKNPAPDPVTPEVVAEVIVRTMPNKLEEVVRAPKEDIEVKIDPYREAIN